MSNRSGQRLGQYRLMKLLGQGGFAEVYLGEHAYLKTPAAIKVLHTRLAGSEDLTGFLREAQMVARLSHPSIVRVLDFGVDGGTPFLVMEYAPGGTLRKRHARGERLALATITSYVEQVANALQYAHEAKVIHRDIKPENMLLGQRQDLLLSDFGIALVAQSSRYQSTQEVIGTVAYMAPEQIQGKPRPASDQYALGIVVYEWLCGDRPFSGSFTELCTQHLFAPVPPLHEKVPAISPEVEDVVTTALAKDPKERFGSVQAFANALKAASKDTPAMEHLVRPPLVSTQQAPPPTEVAVPHDPVLAITMPVRSPHEEASSPPVTQTPLPSRASSAKQLHGKSIWRPNVLIPLFILLLVVLPATLWALIELSAHNEAVHRQALIAAFQALVRHQPDMEYTMQDDPSRLAWDTQTVSDPNKATCSFVTHGYLVTTQSQGGVSVPGTCRGVTGLSGDPTSNLLVQVTLSIQSGKCGELAVSSPELEADLCTDGTADIVSCQGNTCPANPTPAIPIHKGLNVENTLALEVIAGADNQVQLVTFINGQYVDEQTTAHRQDEDGSLFLGTGISGAPDGTSVLFRGVKVWRVPTPVS